MWSANRKSASLQTCGFAICWSYLWSAHLWMLGTSIQWSLTVERESFIKKLVASCHRVGRVPSFFSGHRNWESPNSDEGKYTVVLFIYTYFVGGALRSREYWMIDRGPGSLAVVYFGSLPSPLSRQQVVSVSQSSCVSPVEQNDRRGRGVGEEPNHTTAKESLILYK